jgi:hypothetical protein
MANRNKPSFGVDLPPPIETKFAVLRSVNTPQVVAAVESVPEASTAELTAPVEPVAAPAEPVLEAVPDMPRPAPGKKPSKAATKTLEPSASAPRTHTRKRDGALLRRLQVRLPVDLRRKLNRYCVDREIPAGDVVIQALVAFLD